MSDGIAEITVTALDTAAGMAATVMFPGHGMAFDPADITYTAFRKSPHPLFPDAPGAVLFYGANRPRARRRQAVPPISDNSTCGGHRER